MFILTKGYLLNQKIIQSSNCWETGIHFSFLSCNFISKWLSNNNIIRKNAEIVAWMDACFFISFGIKFFPLNLNLSISSENIFHAVIKWSLNHLNAVIFLYFWVSEMDGIWHNKTNPVGLYILQNVPIGYYNKYYVL